MASTLTYQELRTKYETFTSLPPTEFPNESFDIPNPPEIWARFTIIDGESTQMDLGDEKKTYRTRAQLIIQLFAPLNQGIIPISLLADDLAAFFLNWVGATVKCGATSPKKVGNDDHGWYQVNVLVPFRVDELK